MKLTVDGGKLNMAVKMLSKVINNNNSLPILADFLCEVGGNVMKMTAGNGEAMMSTSVPLDDMEGDGRFCVPAAQLAAAIDALQLQPLIIIADTENGESAQFKIKHTAGETYFHIDNADEYPVWTDDERTEDLAINADVMRGAIKRTVWATSHEDLRPTMCCICFKLSDGNIEIVATDGHSLAKVTTSGEGDYGLRCGSFLMPRSAVRLVDGLMNHVDVTWNSKTVQMTDGMTTIAFRQVEGKYPNYNSIIPDDSPHCVQVPVGILLNALRSTLPFANNSSEMVVMKLGSGKLTLTGEDVDFGRGAFVGVEVDYEEEEVNVGLKGSQLMKILKNIPSEYAYISMTDSNRPVLVEPEEQPDDCDILMLTMPMLINE